MPMEIIIRLIQSPERKELLIELSYVSPTIGHLIQIMPKLQQLKIHETSRKRDNWNPIIDHIHIIRRLVINNDCITQQKIRKNPKILDHTLKNFNP